MPILLFLMTAFFPVNAYPSESASKVESTIEINNTKDELKIVIYNVGAVEAFVVDNQGYADLKYPPLIEIAEAKNLSAQKATLSYAWRLPKSLQAYAFPVRPNSIAIGPGQSVSKVWSIRDLMSWDCVGESDGRQKNFKLRAKVLLARDGERLAGTDSIISSSFAESSQPIVCDQ